MFKFKYNVFLCVIICFFLFKYCLQYIGAGVKYKCSGQALWDWTAKHGSVLSCAYSRSFFIFLQPSSRQHLYKCCSICLSYSPVTLKQTANRIFLLRGDRNSYIRIIKFIQNSYVFISLHCFNGLNSLFVLC